MASSSFLLSVPSLLMVAYSWSVLSLFVVVFPLRPFYLSDGYSYCSSSAYAYSLKIFYSYPFLVMFSYSSSTWVDVISLSSVWCLSYARSVIGISGIHSWVPLSQFWLILLIVKVIQSLYYFIIGE